MTVAELLVLFLRVLPGEIREWLKTGPDIPGTRKEESGTSGLPHDDMNLEKHSGRAG